MTKLGLVCSESGGCGGGRIPSISLEFRKLLVNESPASCPLPSAGLRLRAGLPVLLALVKSPDKLALVVSPLTRHILARGHHLPLIALAIMLSAPSEALYARMCQCWSATAARAFFIPMQSGSPTHVVHKRVKEPDSIQCRSSSSVTTTESQLQLRITQTKYATYPTSKQMQQKKYMKALMLFDTHGVHPRPHTRCSWLLYDDDYDGFPPCIQDVPAR